MSFNRPVTTLFSDTLENKLYIGGYFRFYDSLDYKGVASWDGASITNLSCGLGGCTSVSCGGVIQFESFNGDLYALFIEDSVGCQNIHHIAKWNGSNWISLSQNFYFNSSPVTISSMTILDQNLIISGGFDSILTKKVHGITKYDGLNWDTIFNCDLFTDSHLLIHPLIEYNNIIYAQNYLEDTLGNRQLFSSWNGQCWEKVPGAFSNTSGGITKMIVYKNELYIAGMFDPNHDSQAPGKSIARWNGVRWDDLNGGVQLTNSNYLANILDMAIYNDELYIVGGFQFAGSIPASNIAKWNGSNWCALNNQFSSEITSIAFYHDSIFLGGTFRKIDNDSISFFSKSNISSFDSCESNVSVSEPNNIKFNLYPNPIITGKLNFKSNVQVEELIITDIHGRTLFIKIIESGESQLDISFLSSGVYILIAKTTNGSFINKVLKI